MAQKTFVKIRAEEGLFQKFKALYARISDIMPEATRAVQLEALKTRWAFFLEEITPLMNVIHMTGTNSLLLEYDRFETQCLKKAQE